METKFINREKELVYLNKEYHSDKASLIVVYGRRRIGKTSLIRQFGKDKPMLYFLVTEESHDQVMKKFKEQVAEFTNNELLKVATVNEWEVIFKQLVNFNKDKKKILVFDEFQYLGKSNPAFLSIFQKLWDTLLQQENIMIILCGSLVHMMEAQTLSYSSPLYGRRTGQIKLKTLKFKHYEEFFDYMDKRSLIEYYAVTGGVPRYIELFLKGEDIYDAIDKNILNRQSFLYDEPEYLLQNEVNEIGSYFSLIRTIAAGNHKLNNIASALAVPQTRLTKYLHTLMKLDIIEREVPVTEANPQKSKKGLYFIKDNFIEFWFKFIYPFKNYLEMDNKDYVLARLKEKFVSCHVSFIYEDLCIDKMWDMNERNEIGFNFNRIGRWWDSKNEIDIIAYDSNGKDIIFGECKFNSRVVETDLFYSLLEKAKTVKWNEDDRNEKYILFSFSGFSRKLKKLTKERADLILIEY